MKFGDKVKLKNIYTNYKGKEILTSLGRFNTSTSKLIKNDEYICVELDKDTCCVRRRAGTSLNDYHQFYLPIEVIEVVEDGKKYTEIELQARVNDSFEKGVEMGNNEVKKLNNDILKSAKKEAYENGKTVGHEAGYKEGCEEKKIEYEEKKKDEAAANFLDAKLVESKSQSMNGITGTAIDTNPTKAIISSTISNASAHQMITILTNIAYGNGYRLNGCYDSGEGSIDFNIAKQ